MPAIWLRCWSNLIGSRKTNAVLTCLAASGFWVCYSRHGHRRLGRRDHPWKLGFNPGGAVAMTQLDDGSAWRIAREHRNKPITDESQLIRMGSRSRKNFGA